MLIFGRSVSCCRDRYIRGRYVVTITHSSPFPKLVFWSFFLAIVVTRPNARFFFRIFAFTFSKSSRAPLSLSTSPPFLFSLSLCVCVRSRLYLVPCPLTVNLFLLRGKFHRSSFSFFRVSGRPPSCLSLQCVGILAVDLISVLCSPFVADLFSDENRQMAS
jgi:hypothetical protein